MAAYEFKLLYKQFFIIKYTYRMGAIKSRGLYISYPIFEDHFFGKDVFQENSDLMYGQYSRAGYNGAHTVIVLPDGCAEQLLFISKL